MKAVSAIERPALAMGTANESKIRGALASTLAPHGLAVLFLKEFGLLGDRTRTHVSCSVDGIVALYDAQCKKVIIAISELKTVTASTTVREVLRLKPKMLTRCRIGTEGTSFVNLAHTHMK